MSFDESSVRRDNSGRFDEKPQSQPEVNLCDSSNEQRRADADREAFFALHEPTDADFQGTFETIAADISNDSFPNGPNAWKTVMGAKARRTAKNVEAYNAHLGRVAGNDTEYRAKHIAYARAHARTRSFARAYEQGIAVDPRAEAYFEENWADEDSHFGEAATRRALETVRTQQEALSSGMLRPSSIVGTGYRDSRKVAEEYLARQKSELARALQSRGRSYDVIASNALYRYYR